MPILIIKNSSLLTLWPPRGGKTPAFGTGPASGLLAGGGARAPLLEAQVWSIKLE